MVLAWLNLPQVSGMTYVLIGPLQTWLGSVHGKGRRLLNEAAAREVSGLTGDSAQT